MRSNASASRTRSLWSEAEDIWERHQNHREFRAFVAADYREVYDALVRLQGRVMNILEWGSGLGELSRSWPATSGSRPTASRVSHASLKGRASSQGSTVRRRSLSREALSPVNTSGTPEYSDESFRSDVEAEPGYTELRDFDLVYAFPWPDEQPLCGDIMRKCGGESSLFLSYDAREGILLNRFGQR